MIMVGSYSSDPKRDAEERLQTLCRERSAHQKWLEEIGRDGAASAVAAAIEVILGKNEAFLMR